ncbi:hypothetical protein NECAME_03943 [Necator americanus]|uniref:Uncharacterized protein n=1 Tax=Necator americanus TaxID=51031 RepID=W2SYS3_NECAM|nr:hypothetical protein NECAME_03943 [Necator americanus]ETN74810.1 hypothetical protein NECAME_03943 [Necator americanus]
MAICLKLSVFMPSSQLFSILTSYSGSSVEPWNQSGSVMSGAEADAKDVASEQKEPVAADAAGPEVAEESRDSAASLDNDEKSYSGSEEKNGESEDGGEDEEGGHDEEESNEATTEENGKEGENGHVESTDTNGNDRKRVSDVGVGEAAEDGAPALKKKKGEEEEVLILTPIMAVTCRRGALLCMPSLSAC